jgi:hypothetical protein
MAHNILWHGEIFFHVYMDEKKWMKNKNEWTIFIDEKLKHMKG